MAKRKIEYKQHLEHGLLMRFVTLDKDGKVIDTDLNWQKCDGLADLAEYKKGQENGSV